MELVKTIAHNYKLPYFTISPTFSICKVHGYLSGEHFSCPLCREEERKKIQNKIKTLEEKKAQLMTEGGRK